MLKKWFLFTLGGGLAIGVLGAVFHWSDSHMEADVGWWSIFTLVWAFVYLAGYEDGKSEVEDKWQEDVRNGWRKVREGSDDET